MSVSDRKFFEMAGASAPGGESLEMLSGEVIDDDGTPMIQRAVAAWKTPLDALTCSQARLLVSQKMGLEWLAAPLAAFVLRYPDASATYFPGDLTLAALRAMRELLTIIPQPARAIANLDFAWLTENSDSDPEFLKDAEQTITKARILARGHA
ncbi:MAG TPA: hypothetical protein VGG69_00785 [Rhizomicrobium sp.]|jgi:hypothetical protein